MAQSIEQRGHHMKCVNWNEPQASRLQLHEQPSALNDAWVRAGGCKWRYPKGQSSDAWVRAGGCKWRYPKGQSRTCYQECSCHL